MAADVPCGVRSYVQTRFLATEDSSTLTIALCVSSYKKHTLPKETPDSDEGRDRNSTA